MQAPQGVQVQQPQEEGFNIQVQGRMIWGGVKGNVKKVYGTQNPMIDPKTGKEIIEYAFGLAVPKPGPTSTQSEINNFNQVWTAIHTEAGKQGYQYPKDKDRFAFKFIDGDNDRKENGEEYNKYHKGCIVIACTTRIPLKLNSWIHGPDLTQITEDQVKCGDYFQVLLNIKGHPAPNAGLYVNPSFLNLIGYGEAIINTVDPKTIFGNSRPDLPNGASLTPVGTAPQMPQMGAPSIPNFGNSQSMPAIPNMGQPMAPAVPNFQPNHGVLPGQFQQQAPAQQYVPPTQTQFNPAVQQPMGNVPNMNQGFAGQGQYMNPPNMQQPQSVPSNQHGGFNIPTPGQGY